jgi:hypothetical protein
MLHFVPDWRWLLEREDSPWYPTARLFRQRSPGDWEPVIGDVASALARVAQSGAAALKSAPAALHHDRRPILSSSLN